MATRSTIPKPRTVFEDPEAYLDFLTSPSDPDFEGQHFDRKEACRTRSDGNVAPSELKTMDGHIAECISAFSNTNRNGGLLVLGIASNGDINGLGHLNETQVNRLM